MKCGVLMVRAGLNEPGLIALQMPAEKDVPH